MLKNNMNKKDKKSMKKDKKIRVAVLLGGCTHEKEISLESGRNVVYKLSPEKYQAIPLFLNKNLELFHINQSILVRSSTAEIETLLTPEMHTRWSDLPTIADFVFIALHGGEGENGVVQGALEMLNMPYNGSSVLTSALCMDKFKTTQFLRSHTIDVPQSLLIAKKEWESNKAHVLTRILDNLSFPIIAKPHDDGCSVMVSKVKNVEALEMQIEHLFVRDKDYVLLEECISGIELTVGVIGNDEPHAFPPSQAVVQSEILSIEEKFLPGAGENQTPAPLPKETLRLIQRSVEKTYSVLECKGYARIDCFYQDGQCSPTQQERVVIIEVNTLPGLTPATCLFHQAAEIGIKPMELIDHIIQLGFQEHKQDMCLPQTQQAIIGKKAP